MVATKKQISVGVDIGDTNIITTVMTQNQETGELTVIGYGDVASAGISKGMVEGISRRKMQDHKIVG